MHNLRLDTSYRTFVQIRCVVLSKVLVASLSCRVAFFFGGGGCCVGVWDIVIDLGQIYSFFISTEQFNIILCVCNQFLLFSFTVKPLLIKKNSIILYIFYFYRGILFGYLGQKIMNLLYCIYDNVHYLCTKVNKTGIYREDDSLDYQRHVSE